MFSEQAQEPKLPQHGGGHGPVHVTRAGVPPRSATVAGGCSGTSLVEAASAKFPVPGPWSLPLSPHDAAQLPAKPLVEVLEAPITLSPAPPATNGAFSLAGGDGLAISGMLVSPVNAAGTITDPGVPACQASR